MNKYTASGIVAEARRGLDTTIYTDTAATLGAIRWIKASGTGVTGWKVLYGNTDWRYLDSTHFPNYPNCDGALRRVGDLVTCILQIGTPSYNQLTLATPTGWRGDQALNVGGAAKLNSVDGLFETQTITAGQKVSLRADGVYFGGAATTGTQKVRLTWRTFDPWPTALLGISALPA